MIHVDDVSPAPSFCLHIARMLHHARVPLLADLSTQGPGPRNCTDDGCGMLPTQMLLLPTSNSKRATQTRSKLLPLTI